MKLVVIETKIVVERLNRLSAAEDRICEVEDKPEEITQNIAQKDEKRI